jgi:6-phosphogluconolactonase/glucosamine-6-phosphate isomerase/deaminase
MAAREVVVLVSGEAKRVPLRQLLEGIAGPEIPGSILLGHPNCTILADRDAFPD